MAGPRLAAWVLPLLVAAVPLVAAHVAYALSIAEGHVPACVPYLEGCTSISRAARHGTGNLVFRLLMLPTAVLMWQHWLVARQWLRTSGPTGAGASLPWLGALATLALAVYVGFLGSEGEAYRFLRRHGVVWYFAATYLAMLVQLRALWGAPPRPLAVRLQLAIAIGLIVLGLASVAVSATVAGPVLKDRLENALEWNLGALFTLWFVLQAWQWRRAGLSIGLLRD